MLFSYTATWNYVVYIFLLMWFFPLMMWGNSMGVTLVAVSLIFGAPLAYAGYLIWRGRSAGAQNA
jgi:hypothetical protein